MFEVYLSLGMISTFIPQVTAISRSWVSVVKYNSPVVRLKLKIRVDSNSVNRVSLCLDVFAEFPSRMIIIPCERKPVSAFQQQSPLMFIAHIVKHIVQDKNIAFR